MTLHGDVRGTAADGGYVFLGIPYAALLTAQLVRLPPAYPGGWRSGSQATRPRIAATFGPAVGVTSIGMFSSAWRGLSPSHR